MTVGNDGVLENWTCQIIISYFIMIADLLDGCGRDIVRFAGVSKKIINVP